MCSSDLIKRPLPCPVERVEKQSIFYNVKRKNRARGKEKKIRTKQRGKERKLRKKEES